MDQSEFLQLNLPSGEDSFSIDTLNQNFRKLDLFAKGASSTTESAFQQLILGKPVTNMGLEIFTESGQFDPTKYGLKIGQLIQVIGIGGGGGGGGGGGLGRNGSTIAASESVFFTHGGSGAGGSSGQIGFKAFHLESLDLIPVNIGIGGVYGVPGTAFTSISGDPSETNKGHDGANGTATTFGDILTCEGGIGGSGGSCIKVNNTSGIASGGKTTNQKTLKRCNYGTPGTPGSFDIIDPTDGIPKRVVLGGHGGHGITIFGFEYGRGGDGGNGGYPLNRAGYNYRPPGTNGTDGLLIVTW